MTLQFEQLVRAPAAQVYRAFTNASAMREWFCNVALADPRPGGRLYVWWDTDYYACGEYTSLEPEARIAFSWHGRNEPGTTWVQVSIQPQAEGSLVTVTHSGLGSDGRWPKIVQEFEKGWQIGLENLKSVLETGQDLRFTRRPMLGITVAEFNAEVAAELDVPVSEGIRLDGVLEGLGAGAAGLQADDVIVSLAGQEITGWQSLNRVLRAYRAGDQVPVEFYRGEQEHSLTMELGQRPLPEVPPKAQEMAETVRQSQAEVQAELAQLFEGVSEEAASHRPGAGEWSAKETLAHLIATERETQTWITDLINDAERWSDRFENPTNVLARIQALVAVYPTVAELLAEFGRSQAETVAMLEGLPGELVARRGSYVRLGYALLELPGHHERGHLDQMREAIQAADEG